MYVIIWEFQVKEGYEAEFEQVYGPEGVWVQLFKQGKGYGSFGIQGVNPNP